MATQKLTITLEKDIVDAIKAQTGNVSAALSESALHWLALQKQRQALEKLRAELVADQDVVLPDPDQVSEFEAWGRNVAKALDDTYGHPG